MFIKGDYDEHLKQLEQVLTKLGEAGVKVNARISFFARSELVYLWGYWITREGVMPMKDKVQAIMKIKEPTKARK